MPRGRKKRYAKDFTKLVEHIVNVKEDCICLLSGLCICYTRIDPLDKTEPSGPIDLNEQPSSLRFQGKPSNRSA